MLTDAKIVSGSSRKAKIENLLQNDGEWKSYGECKKVKFQASWCGNCHRKMGLLLELKCRRNKIFGSKRLDEKVLASQARVEVWDEGA